MNKLYVSLLLTVCANVALAQGSYPDRPIRIIYPYPGGPGDTIIRVVAQNLSIELKQPVVVENRPGASGTVGSKQVADSAPNGYTLGMTSNGTHAAVVSLYKNPGYDPLKSFTHIGLYAALPWLLVVRSQFPVSNVTELVAYGRANPGKLTMSVYSSPTKLSLYMLRMAGKFEVLEVPYKGVDQILPDLYSGQLQAAFFPMGVALAQEKAGKVRILGSASARRLGGAPNVPTIAEQLPGVEMTSWNGLAAPAGTPKQVIAKLITALTAALAKPALHERIVGLGAEVATATPDEIEQRIRAEMVTWSKFVKDAGIQPE